MYITTHFYPLYSDTTGVPIGYTGYLRTLFSTWKQAKESSEKQCRHLGRTEYYWEVVFLPINIEVPKWEIEVIGTCRWNSEISPEGPQWQIHPLRWKWNEKEREPYIQLAYDLLNRDPLVLDVCEDVMQVQLTKKKRKRSKRK